MYKIRVFKVFMDISEPHSIKTFEQFEKQFFRTLKNHSIQKRQHFLTTKTLLNIPDHSAPINQNKSSAQV